MRRRHIFLAFALACMSGLMAATLITGYMNMMLQAAQDQKPVVIAEPVVEMSTVVVAKKELTYGSPISREQLTEVKWPAQNVPQGTFSSIEDIYAEYGNRVALATIMPNEPVLSKRMTGPGQRASLSTTIREGMHAVSVRVTDVSGVGGFVLPNDIVDVVFTYNGRGPGDDESKRPAAFADILIKNTRVLAVDQISDPQRSDPKVVRAVTLETSLADAQRLSLASTLGDITLVLRDAAGAGRNIAQMRVSQDDISGESGDMFRRARMQPTNAVAPAASPVPPADLSVRKDIAKVNVVRSIKSTEYTVERVIGRN